MADSKKKKKKFSKKNKFFISLVSHQKNIKISNKIANIETVVCLKEF